MIRLKFAPLVACIVVSGCGASLPAMLAHEEVSSRNEAPPWAEPGTCWGKDLTPAVIETVTEQVVIKPAVVGDDGTVIESAIYKTETHQQIVQEREDSWFETPCETELTPEFNASLQRALKARGHYKGQISGEMDARTMRAVRSFQKPQGLNSGLLSMAAARRLGLIAVDTLGQESDEAVPIEELTVTATAAAQAEDATSADSGENNTTSDESTDSDTLAITSQLSVEDG